MGLRQSFVALGVAFAAIVLLLNGVVLGLAARMDEQSQDLQKTLHGDRAAFEVLNHLVEAARAQRLLNETGDDRWRTQRDTAEGQLFAWLDVADEAARSEDELRAAAELRDAVEAFHEEQLTPPSAAIPPPRISDFSRVDALRDADLREVVTDAWRQYAESSEIHKVREEIPLEPVVVRHDPVRIAQVLGNLLGNAIKYSPGGGEVVLRLWRAPPWGVIEVEDQGIGIPQEAQPKIFEPFTRAQAHEASFPGMGLGLSVVRRLVLAHGGRLEMESQEGVGSTFRILLPLAP